jgi:hypothetical protein
VIADDHRRDARASDGSTDCASVRRFSRHHRGAAVDGPALRSAAGENRVVAMLMDRYVDRDRVPVTFFGRAPGSCARRPCSPT